jgi:hypothetical protein
MTSPWSPEQLRHIGESEELEIAVRRGDGNLGRWVPIWVVCVGQGVYVRTWYRRPDGWFGQVLQSHEARIRVPGVLADVSVTDVGEGSAELRTGVDDAYRTKYSHHGTGTIDQMISDSAAAATLWLQPSHVRD